MKKKSNPNNPLNSSMVQSVLEFKEAGGSLDISMAEFLRLSKEDKETQKRIREADKAVSKKGYPESSLSFYKFQRDIEVSRFLSGEELRALLVFSMGVNQSNLLRISTRDLQQSTGLDIRTVRKCIASLLEKGCIAVKLPGTRNIAATYMLNPEISSIGNSKAFPKVFWELTGSTYEIKNNKNVVTNYSKPHMEWLKISYRTFTIGQQSNGKPDDPEYLKFNVLHFLSADKKTAPSLGDDEAAAGNDGSDILGDSDLS